LPLCLCLAGCLGSERGPVSSSLPPPDFYADRPGPSGAPALPEDIAALAADTPSLSAAETLDAADAAALREKLKMDAVESVAPDCTLPERFDKHEKLAWEFSDGQTRLGVDAAGLGSMHVTGFRVQLTYRFQPQSEAQKKCRYPSPVQGFAGSIYNELFLRHKNTVWDNLDDRGLSFWK
jgi:hypothetical protein